MISSPCCAPRDFRRRPDFPGSETLINLEGMRLKKRISNIRFSASFAVVKVSGLKGLASLSNLGMSAKRRRVRLHCADVVRLIS